MTPELRELYQSMIIDHGRNPRNFREISQPTLCVEGHNPLCGDTLILYLSIEDDNITDVSFKGSGCAISMASASLMTEQLRGKTLAEAQVLFSRFHGMLTGDSRHPLADLGKLSVLGGVREFPVRIKCATLVWHALQQAICGETAAVSTE